MATVHDKIMVMSWINTTAYIMVMPWINTTAYIMVMPWINTTAYIQIDFLHMHRWVLYGNPKGKRNCTSFQATGSWVVESIEGCF